MLIRWNGFIECLYYATNGNCNGLVLITVCMSPAIDWPRCLLNLMLDDCVFSMSRTNGDNYSLPPMDKTSSLLWRLFTFQQIVQFAIRSFISYYRVRLSVIFITNKSSLRDAQWFIFKLREINGRPFRINIRILTIRNVGIMKTVMLWSEYFKNKSPRVLVLCLHHTPKSSHHIIHLALKGHGQFRPRPSSPLRYSLCQQMVHFSSVFGSDDLCCSASHSSYVNCPTQLSGIIFSNPVFVQFFNCPSCTWWLIVTFFGCRRSLPENLCREPPNLCLPIQTGVCLGKD